MNGVGFDFGTTNSLISVVQGNKPTNLLDKDRRPIPSIVCYEGSLTVVGRAAKERLAQAGLGVHGNIVRSPKMYLGQESVFIGVERSPVEIAADVVRHVLDEAKASPSYGPELGDISSAVVTIPVDMEGYRRRALRDAFPTRWLEYRTVRARAPGSAVRFVSQDRPPDNAAPLRQKAHPRLRLGRGNAGPDAVPHHGRCGGPVDERRYG